ncbi:MAG TPA: transcription-repair coupling factor [Gammaproteobacteria bacterium]|nr:transcription-repair coupling factor [Gammaproteobacteria bacterium]
MTSPQRPTPFHPTLPKTCRPERWSGLYAAAFSFAVSHAARLHHAPIAVVTADMQEAARLLTELNFFIADPEHCPVLGFPDWETLPYDIFSPHQDIISQRLEALYHLPELKRGILVLPVSTLMQRVAPRSFLQQHSLVLDVGQNLSLEGMRHRLNASGYRCVSQVQEHGEFAVRGGLLDLYPMGAKAPYRIELFDEQIDSLRTFDPETQRSQDSVAHIRLLPAREFPLDEAAISRFRQAFRTRFEGNAHNNPLYRDVSDGLAPAGIEYYLPLFFEQTETLFDYLPPRTLVLNTAGVATAAKRFWRDVSLRYESLRHSIERPILPPAELFLDDSAIATASAAFPQIQVESFADNENNSVYPTRPPPPLVINARAGRPAETLLRFLDDFPGRVLFAAETPGRRETLLDLLHAHKLRPRQFERWGDFMAGDARLGIAVAPLEQGMLLEDPPLAVISETQLFGEQVVQRRRRQKRGRDSDAVVRDLTELAEGAPVVHEDHGVGRYLGMQTLTVGGIETEFLTIEYAGGDKLYVPVSSLNLISRYSGAAPDQAPLHKLGGEQWAKAKRKAAEKVRDVAAELLDIYARRAARQGHAFPEPDAQYRAFAATFPFEETPDQMDAIDAVINDMRKPQPMDRLVCGDVGFGKTEVAMRAAALAVLSGRQVAVLVPTTLLAQQHYQNFRDRFADWPVQIESLSRFRSGKEQTNVIKGLADGKVDIIIGTHKLLQDSVRFKRLGLVVIDEEHRFGVRQKERLKSLRTEVDILTLTATPIPRTLNMSMAGMRDLSIIATPPSRRLAIKTFVREWNADLIREACWRELKRGGQVYFLYNDVKTIDKKARELAELVPEAHIAIAHGQMRERELEQVMSDFYHQRHNILVCTTIIETGIDIPNANTIIINRADKFGLAQLHQLRGRVGRSFHQAYAYLVVPSRSLMTADAIKRLEAIESLEDLGAGFTLATHDLEIRGAGELLGEDQSGQMQEIGFTLYNQLLERAVADLKAGRQPGLDTSLHHGAEVDLNLPALLPEDYLPDVHCRLVMYKRIANAENLDALKELQVEMIDRFGLLPDAAKNLFRVTALKIKAQHLGIRKIEAGPKGGRLIFNAEPNINPTAIIKLIQTQARTFKLDGQEKLRFQLDLSDREKRFATLENLLDALSVKAAA